MIRKLKMRRIITLLITVILVVSCLSVSSSASSVNMSTQVTYTRDFIVENSIPVKNWNETVMYSAVGFFTLTEVEPYIPEADYSSAYTTATRIVTLISVGELNRESSEDNEDVKVLVSLQNEDGSFGDLNATLVSIMALKACDSLFMSEKAVEWVLSNQSDDGSFSSDGEHLVVTTSHVMTVLSQYVSDSRVGSALEKSIEFLKSQQTENGFFDDGRCDTVCSALIGLVDVGVSVAGDEWGKFVDNLIKFRNDDYSYNMFVDDDVFDSEATLYAVATFDAVGRSKSVYTRLMEDGELNQYSIKDYIPFLTGYGIVACVSIVFWIYLMFFRNRKDYKKVVKIND